MFKRRKRDLAEVTVTRENKLVSVSTGGDLHLIPSNCQHMGARENQEDAFAFSDLEDSSLVKKSGILALVADGMGGLALGEEASKTAVKTFLREYAYDSGSEDEDGIAVRLRLALVVANTAVYDLAYTGGQDRDMGTTMVAVVVKNDKLFYISAGDSRVYLFRDGRLKQLTTDHIYANHLEKDVQDGRISQREADEHPERKYLTSYLGLPRLAEINQDPEPLALVAGDRVILSSDGLFDTLTDEQIAAVMANGSADPAPELVQEVLARENRYQDNVTVLVLSLVAV